MDLLLPAGLVILLLLSAGAGWQLRSRLHERHTTRESVDSIRLMMGMLLTFAALVLGLLTSNAKQRFDSLGDNLNAFAADLVELDHRLRLYGPGADDIRILLRAYAAAAIQDSWPGEPAPSGTYPRFPHTSETRSVEGPGLGDMLAQVDVRIERLAPEDPFHARIAERLRDRAAFSIQQRWTLIFAASSTLAWPFLLILASWLAIIFAIFGMTSPPSRLLYAVVALAALSIASPVYLIIDYSQTLTGLIQLSSAPMRTALAHMDRPQLQP